MTLTRQPTKTVMGALIQIFPATGLLGVANLLPNIVQFATNPDTLTRNFTPWIPTTETGAPAPGAAVQPIDLPEKFAGFKIILDPIAADNSVIPTNLLTVEARLSALRKMMEPSKGLLGDLVASVGDLVNADMEYKPPIVTPVILWLGNRILLPVQFSSFSVVEHQHDALYYPVRATVTVDLTVLTPDRFHCVDSTVAEIAIATYEFTRAQSDLLAVANAADLTPLWKLIVPV